MKEAFYDSVKSIPEDGWKWEYFTPHEMMCKGTGSIRVVPSFLDRLTQLRAAMNRPLIITSAYRSPEYNKMVNEKTGLDGPHTTGRAVDIAIRGADAVRLIEQARALGFTGIGLRQHGANRFVHLDDLDEIVDVRPRPTIWSYA